MTATDGGIRKAAVLVAALDCTAADALLERLPDAQARRVRDAVVALREVDAGEQRRVRDEFMRVRSMSPRREPAGIELDGSDSKLAPPRSSGAEPNRAASNGRPPSAFLAGTAGGDLAEALRSERPQTIALVLAHLAPSRASEVLSRLDPTVQAEVVRRLASLEEADPGVVYEVEQALQSRVARQWGIGPKRVVGRKAVEGILQVGDHRLGRMITETLADRDDGPAGRFDPPPIAFEALPMLDEASLTTLLQEADRQLLAAALLGAPAALVHRVMRLLPQDTSAWVQRQLDSPGPIRLRDVEEARQRLAGLATALQRERRIGPGSAASHIALTG